LADGVEPTVYSY